MCLIAVSPRGTDKLSDFFLNAIRASAQTNSDGFGFAIKRTSSSYVYFSKGFTNLETMIDAIKVHRLNDEDELVVHLRMRSAGGLEMANTHPFQINYEAPSYVSPALAMGPDCPLMFHNGTFSSFIDDSSHSDTYNFAANFMKIKGVWQLLKEDKDKFLQVFKDVIGYNKLVFIGKEISEMIFIGDFHEKNGYIFSNTSYTRYYNHEVSSHLKVVKPEEKDKSILNTSSIQVTANNFEDFEIKAHCDVSGFAPKILKDSRFKIAKFTSQGSKLLMLSNLTERGTYKYISMEALDSCFILIPKEEVKYKYIDYLKLKSTVDITKSSIKKIFNKVIVASGRKNSPERIKLNIKDKDETFDYRAVVLFLRDNSKYINKFRINSLMEEIEPTQKEMSYPPNNYDSCMC